MAINKGRLQELINKGATIYHADRIVNAPIPIFLIEEDVVKEKHLSYEESCVRADIPLEDLYEESKDAEWALKYKRIPRTEYLDLPTWEEIQSNIDEVKNGKDKINISFIKQFNHSQLGYIDLVIVKIEEEPIQLEVSNNDHYVQSWRATEENYAKACDLCVKLFKGNKNK